MCIFEGSVGESDRYFLEDVFYDGEHYYNVSFGTSGVEWRNKGWDYFYILETNIESNDYLYTMDYVLTNKEGVTGYEIFKSSWSDKPEDKIDHTLIGFETIYVDEVVKSIQVNGEELLDSDGYYTEHDMINWEGYPREQAEADGCLWMEYDESNESVIMHGAERLEQFYDKCQQGEDGRIRIAEYTGQERTDIGLEEVLVQDIIYDGTTYYGKQNDNRYRIHSYKYLYCFQKESAVGTEVCYVLSDADDLTLEDMETHSESEMLEVVRYIR